MKRIITVAVVAALLGSFTTAADDLGPIPECPFPSDEITFFPVATDCTRYWECFQGNRYLMSCPNGLHWNADYYYCDYPEIVGCTRGTSTTSSTTSTTTPGSNTTTTPGGNTPDPDCPYPSHDTTFLPHPTDCAKYYECYEGIKYILSCPSGLYWNHVANTCDYKENVDCDRVLTTSTASPITSTTINPTCTNQPDGTYLPHPTDCSKFYECVGGHTIEEQCSGDLLWNQEAHTCDYPEHVTCNSKAAK